MYKQYKEELTRPNTVSEQVSEDRPKLRRQKTGTQESAKEWHPLKKHKSSWNKDVMISYSHANKEFMNRLKVFHISAQ